MAQLEWKKNRFSSLCFCYHKVLCCICVFSERRTSSLLASLNTSVQMLQYVYRC